MVKLSNNLLSKYIAYIKNTKAGLKNKKDNEIIKKITHLQLQNRMIDGLDFSVEFPNLLTLYLQNNRLTRLENLEKFPLLTNLYLQRNNIQQMSDLNLKNLKKLYLGYNEINVVEDLGNVPQLEELHLEHQRLPLGETLYFDPRAVDCLKCQLKVLNVSGNNLITLMFLRDIELQTLLASENQLHDLIELSELLKSLNNLIKLDLTENPITLERDYKNCVLANSKNIQCLDGKEISGINRIFVQNMTRARELKNPPLMMDDIEKNVNDTITTDEENKGVRFSILKKQDLADKTESFPSWKIRKNVNPLNMSYCISKPFYKVRNHQKS